MDVMDLQRVIQVREHQWPRLAMPIAGGLTGEARVPEGQAGGATHRSQFDRDDGLSSIGTASARDPRELDQLIDDEPEKAAVMRMTAHRRLTFSPEFGFEEEHGVHLRKHQHRPGYGEPSIESDRPGLIKGRGRSAKVSS